MVEKSKDLGADIKRAFTGSVRPDAPKIDESRRTDRQVERYVSFTGKSWTEIAPDDFWEYQEAIGELNLPLLAYYLPAFLLHSLNSRLRFFQSELTEYEAVMNCGQANNDREREFVRELAKCLTRQQREAFYRWIEWQARYRDRSLKHYIDSGQAVRDLDLPESSI